ncbi:MAG: aldo/keto reductase [Gammaproteobacteria bacterium]|nr:aldo/keto reductase [Gammaproteobacteria bacterium]
MIERIPFGHTGHMSTRTIFGAAALGSMRQEKADAVLELLLEFGVNHIDTAAGYGDSELRIAPWMAKHRDRFFLATKTGARDAVGARESLARSLDRLGVDQIDLIQLHNLVETGEQDVALGPGGALEALVSARDAGLVRFIGVTGHGTFAPKRHRESLRRFPFDSVLVPSNFAMLAQPEYARDFEELHATCQDRGVAFQTIKSIARGRWRVGDDEPRHSWYRPIRDQGALQRAVRFVLSRPGAFLNTSSDTTLLRATLEAAATAGAAPSDGELREDCRALGVEPLFVRGVSDRV